jgi:aminoglycoside phosphotransferase (APT) family kinase protein
LARASGVGGTHHSAQQLSDTGRLNEWLEAHVEGYRGPTRIEKFADGQSNPTFRLSAKSGEYVLRRKPMGNVLPSAHAVDREFRVLNALAATDVPIARVHALCTDSDVIGSMFYVMDLVPGRVFWDPRLPELAPDERTSLFDSMNETVARIHSLDPDALDLNDYGRKGGYLERQVARWSKQYVASQTVPNPAMDSLMEWLPRHLPEESETRIVHGDLRLDNLIIHPTEPRVVAVLDWELSTLGDPIADFAYHVMTWRIPPDLFRGLAGVDFAAAGIPDEDAYLGAYLRRVGRPRPAQWEFFLVLSLFRIAAILQGIAKRSIDGSASSANAAEVGAKAVPLSQLAWELAQDIKH